MTIVDKETLERFSQGEASHRESEEIKKHLTKSPYDINLVMHMIMSKYTKYLPIDDDRKRQPDLIANLGKLWEEVHEDRKG